MITGPLAVAKNTNLLPTVSLGPHRVTRLIVGSNPIRGYSHFNPQYSRQMAEWSTDERVVQLLLDCEKAGINTFQSSTIRPACRVTSSLRAKRGANCSGFVSRRPPTHPLPLNRLLSGLCPAR
jgi:hypothetical protein